LLQPLQLLAQHGPRHPLLRPEISGAGKAELGRHRYADESIAPAAPGWLELGRLLMRPLPACGERAQQQASDFFRCRTLLQLVGDLLDASLGARLVASLVVAAYADAADGVVAHIDRITAAQRNHLGELTLTRILSPILLAGVGAVAPLERRAAEGAGRIGLASSELQAMRARVVGRNEHAHATGAIDDRDRDGNVALGTFRDRRLGNLKAE